MESTSLAQSKGPTNVGSPSPLFGLPQPPKHLSLWYWQGQAPRNMIWINDSIHRPRLLQGKSTSGPSDQMLQWGLGDLPLCIMGLQCCLEISAFEVPAYLLFLWKVFPEQAQTP